MERFTGTRGLSSFRPRGQHRATARASFASTPPLCHAWFHPCPDGAGCGRPILSQPAVSLQSYRIAQPNNRYLGPCVARSLASRLAYLTHGRRHRARASVEILEAAVVAHLEVHRVDYPAGERAVRFAGRIENPDPSAAIVRVEILALVRSEGTGGRRGVVEGTRPQPPAFRPPTTLTPSRCGSPPPTATGRAVST